MIAALIVLTVVVVLDAIVWGALIARWLGIPAVRLTTHTGQHVVRPVTLPLTEQVIEVKQTDDKPPWDRETAAQPVLNDDAETLALYRGELLAGAVQL